MITRRIGILTLLNQLNYGGVLQAYALQRVLLSRGYAAELVDYWLAPRNALLNGHFFDPGRSTLKRASRIAGYLFKRGIFYVWSDYVRRRQTRRFIRDHITLSPRPYPSAQALAEINGYDCLVVGSDQVWNYAWHGRPNPFLLGPLDAATRRISYAASFGFRDLPEDYLKEYRECLEKFAHISVREKEGAALVRQWTGREAQWVLDPTLLLPEAEWRKLLAERPTDRPFVFCYWLGDLRACLMMLSTLPRPNREKVLLYMSLQQLYGRRKLSDWLLRMRLLLMPHVRLCCGAGPREYLSGIAYASAVVSDSFHSLMFSCIFRKPVKIVINSSAQRAGMSARMRDFAARYTLRDVLDQEVSDRPLAFGRPNYDEVWCEIEKDRSQSLRFLQQSLP
jgi:hypothetical protein